MFQKIKCFFGGHKWETVKQCSGRANVGSLFQSGVRTDVLIVVKKCKCCCQFWGYVTDGLTKQNMDVDYLFSKMN